MAEVTLTINGKNYGIACDDGQESRVIDLGHHIDQKMREIARAGAANNESHLMILTALMLADETFDLRDEISDMAEDAHRTAHHHHDEATIVGAIGELTERVDEVTGRILKG